MAYLGNDMNRFFQINFFYSYRNYKIKFHAFEIKA